MTTNATTIASRLPLIAPELLRSLVPTMVINLLCAVVVTYLMRIGAGFVENLVFSMCIGTTAMMLIDCGRILLWGKDEPNKPGFFLMLLIFAPLSFFIGNVIAGTLIGRPVELLALGQANNTIGVIVLILLVCVGATLFYWNREKMAALEARNVVIEKQAVQAQLQMLQAQIEPHMLFNTLATLQTLISTEPIRAQQMLDQLIHYLRATLSTSRSAQTTMGQEFELTKAYLGLMSLRMGLRLTYSLQLPDELRPTPIAPMLLQPLVENAIRHGLEPKVEGGDCTVRVTVHDGMLIVSVFDTGMGLNTSTSYNKPDSTHLGLENIRARLDALYGPLAELTLTHNIPEGAVAQITIPMAALYPDPTR
ncbi:putative signal transduction protein with a C-terminal ATPase domain containing protein [Herbaspirillum sp. CF444]|uniref:sensor histidine kinase n=1 Tax=Herbaspirillum sp. CF444 TaxID=1144319 RepID=UPI00027278AE|nr:histidine kinase [Herbaspirillum sp. CF444]EJL93481.1 putative signal transduction protein with a C-terminal ATPase domain containing protein [Herbaspirillum sp. CF444]